MQQELLFAKDIQTGILPKKDQEYNGIRIHFYWRPMMEVAGDFYDVFSLPGGYLGILVADASGHGVPAALLTTMAKISFSSYAKETIHPKEIFQKANRELSRIIQTSDYLTAFFLSISENHEFFYANASHPPALLYRKKAHRVEKLDTMGLFIGAMQDVSSLYEEKKASLEPGDRIILYTDGITERSNPQGEEFGMERLIQAVLEYAHLDPKEMLNRILHDVEKFAQGTPHQDDMTLCILEAEESYHAFLQKFQEGYQLIEKGKKEEAHKLLKEALLMYDKHLQALFSYGMLSYELGDYEEAKKALEKYLSISQRNSEVYFWLMVIAIKEKRYQEAISYGEKAITLRPNYAEAYHNMAVAYFYLKNYEKTKEYLKKAISLDPENREYKATYVKLQDIIGEYL